MPRNLRTQYTSRTVPGAVDVTGNVTNGATVLVNSTNACQVSEYDALGNPCSYYWRAATVANGSGPVFQGITNAAHLPASPSYSPATYTNIGHIFVPKTPETYSYDLDGNLTSDGHWNYYWDGENRLIAMTNNASIAAAGEYALTFAYDYKGRRIQKAVYMMSGSSYAADYTDDYMYDGWNPVAIVTTSNTLVNSMLWGADLSGSQQGASGVGGLLAENLGGTNGVHFVAHDGNGNVAALVSATSGTVTANYEYGPFYELIRATGPMATVNQMDSSDKIRDPETGFYYYGHRYYNPSTGRWLSRDPTEEDGGPNLYVIGNNDLSDFIDALGMACCACTPGDLLASLASGTQTPLGGGPGHVTAPISGLQGFVNKLNKFFPDDPKVKKLCKQLSAVADKMLKAASTTEKFTVGVEQIYLTTGYAFNFNVTMYYVCCAGNKLPEPKVRQISQIISKPNGDDDFYLNSDDDRSALMGLISQAIKDLSDQAKTDCSTLATAATSSSGGN